MKYSVLKETYFNVAFCFLKFLFYNYVQDI
jgi:hypothetical protein